MFFHPAERPKAKPWDGRRLTNVRVEIKLDGHRYTLVKHAGKISFLPRKYDLDAWHYFEHWHNRAKSGLYCPLAHQIINEVPDDTVLDGELYLSGKPATDIVTAIREDPRELKFQPFAMPISQGRDTRIDTEDFGWIGRDLYFQSMGFDAPKCLGASPEYKSGMVHNFTELEGDSAKSYLENLAKEWGVEGFVLKTDHYSGWWKVKQTSTCDLVVIDTKAGKGQHLGRIGALICGVLVDGPGEDKLLYPQPSDYKEVASVGKGKDDEWRDCKPEEVIGKVIEVSHEGFQVNALKFSSFVRWRDDKSPHECTWESQIEPLIK